MKRYVVYRILNVKNDRIYIGSSSNFEVRRLEHLGLLRTGKHHNKFLQSDFNDFKEDNFVFDVIDELKDREAMLIREYELILKHKSKCYNIHTDCPVATPLKKSKSARGRRILYVKKLKLSKKEKNKRARVKGNHKIKTDHPTLDAIAERKKQREQKIGIVRGNN